METNDSGSVHRQHGWTLPAATATALDQTRSGGRDQSALSRREREVLALIVLGKTDRQIAEELFISRITVSSHVCRILDKLDVPNRTAAAARAVSAGDSLAGSVPFRRRIPELC